MQDLDSYQVFCALELLKSKQRSKSAKNQNHNEEDEVVCACAEYLKETL